MRVLGVLLIGCLVFGQAPAHPADGRMLAVEKAFAQGDFRQARLQAEGVWREARGLGEDLRAGVAAANVAAVLTMMGQFEDARLWQDRAGHMFEAHPDPVLAGHLAIARAITTFLGSRQYGAGAPDEALVHLKRARQLLGPENVRLKTVEAEILGQSSKAQHVQDGYAAYVQLLTWHTQQADSLAVAQVVMRLARLEGDTGGHQAALAACLRARAIFRQAGDVRAEALALRNAGHAYRKLRAYARAEEALIDGLARARQSGDGAVVVRVLNDLSRLYAEMGAYERATEFDRQADGLLDEIARAIPGDRAADSVTLSFQHLLLLRFATLLPYEVDLYSGFYEALVLHMAP